MHGKKLLFFVRKRQIVSKKVFSGVVRRLEKLSNPNDENKSYTLDDIREKHPQAYQPWSTEEDEKLEALFCEGKTVKELELKEKYS